MKYQILAILLVFWMSATAQTLSDSIQLVYQLQSAGSLKSASRLLKKMHTDHPADLSLIWLYAGNEYWRKHFKNSGKLYRQAIKLDSQNEALFYDYIDFLVNTGKYNKANSLLRNAPKHIKASDNAFYHQSRLEFWSGNVKTAENLAMKIETKGFFSENSLLEEIRLARAPGLMLSSRYSSDTQPLQRFDAGINGSWFYSSLLDLSVDAAPSLFSTPEGYNGIGSSFLIGNKIRFASTGTELGASVGVFTGLEKEPSLIYNFSLKQRIFYGLNLSVSHRQEPYLFTLSSLDNSFGYRVNTLQLEWQQRHGWWINAGGQQELFQNPDNTIFTWYGWVMSPEMNLGDVKLRLGYSISWADAFVSQYEALDDIDVIMGYWLERQFIEGQYVPYFTPSKMLIHNAMILLDWKIGPNLNFLLSGDYGFLATAQNPYLFPELVDINRFGLQRAFEKYQFTPFKIDGRLVAQINKQANASLFYNYTRIFFYDMRSAGLSVSYKFIK